MLEQKVNEDDEDCFIFCDKHVENGKKELKLGGKDRLAGKVGQSNPKRSLLNDDQKKKSGGQKNNKKRVIEEEEIEEPDENAENLNNENDEDDEAYEKSGKSRLGKGKKKLNGLISNNHVPIRS